MTIETAMWFALGFLVAVVLALVFMSSLWARAVRLTTRRIATNVPADAEAALAEKDLLAARFARDLRRHEMALSDLRRRHAEERIAVGRGVAALDALRQERDADVARIEAVVARLQRDLAARDAELEAGAVSREAQAARFEALQADLAEKKARIEDLLRTLGLAETASGQEKDRADRLDRRIERLVADVADREEIADRRQRELERARQALASSNARIAALTGTPGKDTPARLGDNSEHAVERLEHEKADLEARLEASERERDRLAVVVRDLERVRNGGDGAPARAELRDRMVDLAAEMVRLTGTVEGATSPLDEILAKPDAGGGPRGSLAERIRAVRAAGDSRARRAEKTD